MHKVQNSKKRRLAGAMVAMFAASLTVASVATAATNVNQPGSVCKNFIPAEAGNMDYYANGIRSTKAGATRIVCPVTRPVAFLNGGATFWIDVKHVTTQTTTCTAFSHAAGGRLLASNSGSFTGIGVGSIRIDVRGTGLSDFTSDFSVLCTIPGSGQGLLSGVHTNEF